MGRIAITCDDVACGRGPHTNRINIIIIIVFYQVHYSHCEIHIDTSAYISHWVSALITTNYSDKTVTSR